MQRCQMLCAASTSTYLLLLRRLGTFPEHLLVSSTVRVQEHHSTHLTEYSSSTVVVTTMHLEHGSVDRTVSKALTCHATHVHVTRERDVS
jgi:hypothetical protein